MGGYDRAAIHSFLHKNLQLAGNDEAFQTLGNFFAALNAPARKPAIHVLHYGDSQIEGDRITGHLRNAWQSLWGGAAPVSSRRSPPFQAWPCGNLGPVNGNAMRALANKTPPYSTTVTDSWRRLPSPTLPSPTLHGQQRARDLNPILGATGATARSTNCMWRSDK